MLINGNFAYSSYLIALEEALLDPRSSGINGFNLGLDFTNFNGENELQYGIEVLGYQTDFDFTNSSGIQIEQKENLNLIFKTFHFRVKF